MADRQEHYTVGFEADARDWWPGRCHCGAFLGMFPTAEDAADALMQHAREQGYLEAQHDAIAMSRGVSRG